MKEIVKLITIPDFPGYHCVGHGLPKKGQYFINGVQVLEKAGHDFQNSRVLIYEKLAEPEPVPETPAPKIPEFPGYTFDRIGTPFPGEYMLTPKGLMEEISYPKLQDKNYVIYEKLVEANNLKFLPLSKFVGRQLNENEVLIVHRNHASNFCIFWAGNWNKRPAMDLVNSWACLITFEKEKQ